MMMICRPCIKICRLVVRHISSPWLPFTSLSAGLVLFLFISSSYNTRPALYHKLESDNLDEVDAEIQFMRKILHEKEHHENKIMTTTKSPINFKTTKFSYKVTTSTKAKLTAAKQQTTKRANENIIEVLPPANEVLLPENDEIDYSETLKKESRNVEKANTNVKIKKVIADIMATSEPEVKTTPIPKLVFRIDNTTRKPYVFIYNLGRFGNILFQFASLYGIAASTNRTAKLFSPAYAPLTEMFKGISVGLLDMPLGLKVRQFSEEYAGKYEPVLTRYWEHDTELCCYLQSWRYFQNHEADLRKQLVLRDEIQTRARQVLSGLLSSHHNDNHHVHRTLVGVHVRRMDVTSSKQLKRGYTYAPKKYFDKAMNYYRTRFKNCLFIICSDDLSWAEYNIQGPDILYNTEDADVDFALLMQCNHTIISVGSYGWWAGWLAGGEVVYYSDWPIPNTEIGSMYNHDDYFPPHWVGIGFSNRTARIGSTVRPKQHSL